MDSTSATKEPGEPDHAGDSGGASVWFSWTPNVSGTMTISTTGSTFDTLLGVYTGSSVSSLTLVGSNDDVSASASASRVCFNATSGTTYRIAVDGYMGATGAIDIDWGVKPDIGPCPTLPPTISGATGTPTVGDQLTVTDGTWVEGGPEAIQWQRCAGGVCSAIGGATAATHTLTSRDVGNVIRVDITSSGNSVTARNSAAPTAVVGMPPIGPQPNGRIISTAHNGTWQVYSRFEDGSGLTPITTGLGDNEMASVSPDGRFVVYVDSGTTSLHLSTTDGRSSANIPYNGIRPVWSPDGTRIAFLGGPFFETTLETFDLVTGDHTVLRTFDIEQIADLAWAPDGRTIAFTYNAGGQFDIATIPANGRGPITNVTQTSSQNEQAPAWSPSGDRISYTVGVYPGSSSGDADLWVMNANGTNAHKLVDSDTTHPIAASSWSPDAQKILYTRYDFAGQKWQLFTVNAAGGVPQELTPTEEGEYQAVWAPATRYTLSADVSGSGSISSTPTGLSCTTACSAEFADPTSVTLTATPNTGSTFTGWSGDCTGTAACVVSMNGDRDVTARFTSAATSSGGGGGNVPVDLATSISTSSAAVPVGGSVTYRIAVTDKTAATATGLHVLVTLPAGATVGVASTDRGSGCAPTARPDVLNCDLNYLAANPTVGNILLVLTLSQAGQATLTASAGSNQVDINQADNVATSVVTVGAATPPPPPPPPPTPKPKLTPVPARALTGVRRATMETVGGALTVNGRMKLTLHVTPLHSTKQLSLLATSRLGTTTLHSSTRLLHASTRAATRVALHLAFLSATLKRGSIYMISITGTDTVGRHTTLLMRFKA